MRIFYLLFLVQYAINDRTNEIEKEQISIILGDNYVVSIQEKGESIFNAIKERLEHSRGRIRKMGSDYLAYTLIDIITDNYFKVLEDIGEKIEYLEEELVTNPTANTLQTIHELKRELIILRKNVWPMREVINKLDRIESELISDSLSVYLRDVYDHTIQVIDLLRNIQRYDFRNAGYLPLEFEQPNERSHEITHNNFYFIYSTNIHSWFIWYEFQVHARATVGLWISSGLDRNDYC